MRLTVPTPIDNLTPDNTPGGVYKALYDTYGPTGTDSIINSLRGGICKHTRSYIGSTNFFYGRWKQHRRGPKHHGSKRIWEAINKWQVAVAFSVLHPNEDLEDAFIHTSGMVTPYDKESYHGDGKDINNYHTGNILHTEIPDDQCGFCAEHWGITLENRNFVPRYHNIWDPKERTWTQYDLAEHSILSVRQLRGPKLPTPLSPCGEPYGCDICESYGPQAEQCGTCYGSFPHKDLRRTWACGPLICVHCLASLQGRT